MQTFLPYPNFVCSAMVLDDRRLGKQRVEARTIQGVLQQEQMHREQPTNCPPPMGWSHHPAVRMWEGYVVALQLYGDCMIREWVRRGHENTMPMMHTSSPDEPLPEFTRNIEMPPWLGDERFHASHRSMLLAKDPEHYGTRGWEEEPGLPYVWPVPGRGRYGLAISG